jgi:hypothetical protein
MDFWHVPQWAQRKTKVHPTSGPFNLIGNKNVQPNRRNDESLWHSWRLDNSSWCETSFDYNNKLVCASITQRVYKNNCIGAVCCVHNFVTTSQTSSSSFLYMEKKSRDCSLLSAAAAASMAHQVVMCPSHPQPFVFLPSSFLLFSFGRDRKKGL